MGKQNAEYRLHGASSLSIFPFRAVEGFFFAPNTALAEYTPWLAA
jgi:hypothetical protein